jgi:hypothetical protein
METKDIITISCSVMTPTLAAVTLYYLNKKKELRFKKSDVAGTIYENLLKLAVKNNTLITNFILIHQHANIIRIMKIQNIHLYKKNNVDFYNAEMMRYNETIDILEADIENSFYQLMKGIGTFRFYISSQRRKKIDSGVKLYIKGSDVILKSAIPEIEDINEIDPHYIKILKANLDEYHTKSQLFTSEVEYMLDGFY